MSTVCDVLDLAFGEDRKFLTLEQFFNISTEEFVDALCKRQHGQDEKVLMLESICKVCAVDKKNVYFFDDLKNHILAALKAGYKNARVVDFNEEGIPPIVEHLLAVMKECIPKEDLRRLIVLYGDQDDLQTRRWLRSRFGFLEAYELDLMRDENRVGLYQPVVRSSYWAVTSTLVLQPSPKRNRKRGREEDDGDVCTVKKTARRRVKGVKQSGYASLTAGRVASVR